MSYLTLDEMQALLAQPDIHTTAGRRDLTMLSLLYDTGARVQELADLELGDVRFSSPTVIRLTGNGGKARLVPIMTPTEKLLRAYLEECCPNYSAHNGYPLFYNRNGKKLTRAGIAYILNKYGCVDKVSVAISREIMVKWMQNRYGRRTGMSGQYHMVTIEEPVKEDDPL